MPQNCKKRKKKNYRNVLRVEKSALPCKASRAQSVQQEQTVGTETEKRCNEREMLSFVDVCMLGYDGWKQK